MTRTEAVVVGGGIVGLATAYAFVRRFPGKRVLVLEKEKTLAHHQTGRNSGVLHSGIYYEPGSLKSENCREGRRRMIDFCRAEGIPHEICGKVIVAVDAREEPALRRILERGRKNGVRCDLVGPDRLRELEPHAAGLRALHVPGAGIVDFRRVAERLARIVEERGGEVVTGARVTALRREASSITVVSSAGEHAARSVINCAGLHSDRVRRLGGAEPGARIVPFRGEYYELLPRARHLCRNLIYPVPDPRFPFLGVHFTRTMDGGVECGPNAVLAFAREGYTMATIDLADVRETFAYPGFRRMARKHWRMGLAEMWRSVSKAAFVRALQRLLPDLRAGDLRRAPAGVRAQAVRVDGKLVDDFLIEEGERTIDVCNAPSPAATSSLNIGELVVDRLAARSS